MRCGSGYICRQNERDMKSIIGIFLATVFFSSAVAQNEFDIATVMCYNILNYRNSFGDCDGNTNPSGAKEDHLKVIIKHVDPDIICFNEVGNSINNIARLQSNVLNTDGETKYAFTDYNASGSLMNVTFFNEDLFGLYQQDAIEKELTGIDLVRLIDVITFYHKEPNLALTQDTNLLTVFVAHLKAGQNSFDFQSREHATEAIMDYIANHPEIGPNYLLAGDLNVYDGSDQEFQNLITGPADQRFYDPIDQIGNWDNSASFAYVHTQSTRLSQTNGGCFSGGGMDNRFDFILASEAVMDNNQRVEYINTSYTTLGQDGNRFNQTITFPSNSEEPQAVIDALYEVSDHLPVILDLKMEYSQPSSVIIPDHNSAFSVVNPIKNEFRVTLRNLRKSAAVLEVVNIQGQTVHTEHLDQPEMAREIRWNAGMLEPGIYFIRLVQDGQKVQTQKVVKI